MRGAALPRGGASALAALAGALLGAALFSALTARPAAASQNPAALCLAAADAAGDRHGVPRAVMRALTRTETGRSRDGALQPWPWTVNMEGEGRWFDSRAEALDYVRQSRARGARSFDVGCFQVNHLWHGEHFASVEAMFDPAANADYAARFLAGLHAETGSWPAAAGYYHSRTPKHFARYRARFEQVMARGDPDAPAVFAAAPAAAGDALPGWTGGTIRPKAPLWRTVEARRPASPGGVSLRLAAGTGPLVGGAARPLLGAP
jgi:soluble lytic murein transglycosylase-like protein